VPQRGDTIYDRKGNFKNLMDKFHNVETQLGVLYSWLAPVNAFEHGSDRQKTIGQF